MRAVTRVLMNEPTRTAAGHAALIRRASRRVCGSFASGSAHVGIQPGPP